MALACVKISSLAGIDTYDFSSHPRFVLYSWLRVGELVWRVSSTSPKTPLRCLAISNDEPLPMLSYPFFPRCSMPGGLALHSLAMVPKSTLTWTPSVSILLMSHGIFSSWIHFSSCVFLFV